MYTKKEERKRSLFPDDTLIFIEKSQRINTPSKKNPLRELINKYRKVARHKVNMTNAFLNSSNEQLELENFKYHWPWQMVLLSGSNPPKYAQDLCAENSHILMKEDLNKWRVHVHGLKDLIPWRCQFIPTWSTDSVRCNKNLSKPFCRYWQINDKVCLKNQRPRRAKNNTKEEQSWRTHAIHFKTMSKPR